MTIDADNKKRTDKAVPNKYVSSKSLSWEKIETVLLDMDGTLLDLHFDNHFWQQYVPLRYAEKHGLSHDKAHEQLMSRYDQVQGSLDWYCIDFWSRELSLDIEQLKQDIAEKISIRPDVVEFLSWLNAMHKRVVLVTNAHPVSLDIKMAKTNLHVHFDKIVNAHDIGLAKEHEGFWQKLQAVEPFDRASSVLIDDNLEVLACAFDYGIKYCLAIKQPDSQGGVIKSDEFEAISSFKELFAEV